MSTRRVLAAVVTAAGLSVLLHSGALALPLSSAASESLGSSSLVQEARVFCYNRYTGRFLHWGRCRSRVVPRRAAPRVYCYNRRTGRFLHWGACRR